MLPAPRREGRQEPRLAGIRDVRLHYREGGGERDGFCSSAGAGNRDAVQREERSRELVPIILVLWEKEEEEESWGPRTPRCGTLTLTKVLPEVQVRRWRRLSGRGFMTKSGSYSLLSPLPSPILPPHHPGLQCTRQTRELDGDFVSEDVFSDYVFHNAVRRDSRGLSVRAKLLGFSRAGDAAWPSGNCSVKKGRSTPARRRSSRLADSQGACTRPLECTARPGLVAAPEP